MSGSVNDLLISTFLVKCESSFLVVVKFILPNSSVLFFATHLENANSISSLFDVSILGTYIVCISSSLCASMYLIYPAELIGISSLFMNKSKGKDKGLFSSISLSDTILYSTVKVSSSTIISFMFIVTPSFLIDLLTISV